MLMGHTTSRRGMTLVEVLIVVTLLGILGMLAVPAVVDRSREANDKVFVTQLKSACDAFQRYRLDHGAWPPDRTPAKIPPGMASYLGELEWIDPTPIGGAWDWDKGQFGYQAGVSVYKPQRDDAGMAEIDAIFDDGRLKTGAFRKRKDGYMRIISESAGDTDLGA